VLLSFHQICAVNTLTTLGHLLTWLAPKLVIWSKVNKLKAKYVNFFLPRNFSIHSASKLENSCPYPSLVIMWGRDKNFKFLCCMRKEIVKTKFYLKSFFVCSPFSSKTHRKSKWNEVKTTTTKQLAQNFELINCWYNIHYVLQYLLIIMISENLLLPAIKFSSDA
jgi:hypothetical protein